MQSNTVSINKEEIDKFLESIITIHNLSYDQEHFTSLFNIVKLSEYYRKLICAGDVSLVHFENKCLVGFVIAGENISRGVSDFTSENKSYLIKLLLCNPKFLLQKVISKIKIVFSKNTSSGSSFRLLSIAVHPDYHSKGIGSKLLANFERKLAEKNIGSYGLSVRSSNIKAINFYIKMGLKIAKIQHGSIYFFRQVA